MKYTRTTKFTLAIGFAQKVLKRCRQLERRHPACLRSSEASNASPPRIYNFKRVSLVLSRRSSLPLERRQARCLRSDLKHFLGKVLAVLMLLAVQISGAFAQNDNVQKVAKLHDDKKYREVLSVIDPLLIEYKNVPAYLSKLHFIRGSARFNTIYLARTGGVFGADTAFDEKRSRFEMTFQDSFTNLVNGALGDFEQAIVSGQASTEVARKNDGNDPVFTYDQNFETGILNLKALTHLEKAQFITNSYADFSAAAAIFGELDTVYNANIVRFGGMVTGETTTRAKQGEMLAAEIRTKVALGNIEAAYALFYNWQKANGYGALKKELSIPAMIEALDLTGNYKYAEAFLVREAVRQITLDKGAVVPANLAIHKAAMKSHLYNMNFAAQISPAGKLLPFQRARLAGAYYIKGNLTPAESAFIKNAPDIIKTEKETPPFDAQLFSVMLKLQSTDAKETDAARKTLDEMLKKDATGAAMLAVRGYSAMLKENLTAAETDLSAAIKKDPFLAFAHGAFQNRALVYQKSGKADLAAKDEKQHAQFRQLLAMLAAA